MQYVFTCVTTQIGLVKPIRLLNCDEQTCYGSQKGNAFDECRRQDHVGTNVICSFRLAGNTLYSAFTNLADTDTGTDGREACANCAISGL
jgi:hypothetical protein